VARLTLLTLLTRPICSMFFHLQYIHLFRPFLKYTATTSPLPPKVSPWRLCRANASAISKLMRQYRRTWGLGQICSISVYMIHSASIIHLVNMPDHTSRRDLVHNFHILEDIAEAWPCARRTLAMLVALAKKWSCEMPAETAAVMERINNKYGPLNSCTAPSSSKPRARMASMTTTQLPSPVTTSNVIPAEQQAENCTHHNLVHGQQQHRMRDGQAIMSIPRAISAPMDTDMVAAETTANLAASLPMASSSSWCDSSTTSARAMEQSYSPRMVSLMYQPERRPSIGNGQTQQPTQPYTSAPSDPPLPLPLPSDSGQYWFSHGSVRLQKRFDPWVDNDDVKPIPAMPLMPHHHSYYNRHPDHQEGDKQRHYALFRESPPVPLAGTDPDEPVGNMFVPRGSLTRPMPGEGPACKMESEGISPGYIDLHEPIGVSPIQWSNALDIEE